MPDKMITLRSSEGKEFVVAEKVAKMSVTICHMIEDDCADGTTPLPNVNSKIMRLVIDYCIKHVSEEEPAYGDAELQAKKEMDKWDKEFLDVDDGTLFDLILAAHYLNIQGLFDLTCKNVADRMRGHSPEEIRKMFKIKNDYTPEEEAEVRRENHWAFE